jgi:Tfp pilus assembly protein FimT
MRSNRQRGFSLLEAVVVASITLLATTISIVSAKPMLMKGRVDSAYAIALGALRQAREKAVDERTIYVVTFNNAVSPNTVTVAQFPTMVVASSYALPGGIAFSNEPGIPNTAATTPDRFGVGNAALDLDQNVAGGVKNTIYFFPDGSGQDLSNNINNGVVYIARPGELMSSRAITVWGATGRIRGWRLQTVGGVNSWSQQ